MDLGDIIIKDTNGCLEAVRERRGGTEARRNLWVIFAILSPQPRESLHFFSIIHFLSLIFH